MPREALTLYPNDPQPQFVSMVLLVMPECGRPFVEIYDQRGAVEHQDPAADGNDTFRAIRRAQKDKLRFRCLVLGRDRPTNEPLYE